MRLYLSPAYYRSIQHDVLFPFHAHITEELFSARSTRTDIRAELSLRRINPRAKPRDLDYSRMLVMTSRDVIGCCGVTPQVRRFIITSVGELLRMARENRVTNEGSRVDATINPADDPQISGSAVIE